MSKCGCRPIEWKDTQLRFPGRIEFCPLHAAAEELLKIVKDVQDEFGDKEFTAHMKDVISRAAGKGDAR